MSQAEQKQQEVAKEMAPFFLHIIWPVAIIIVIAFFFAPAP